MVTEIDSMHAKENRECRRAQQGEFSLRQLWSSIRRCAIYHDAG